MAEFYTVVTNKGMEVLQECIISNKKFPATKMAVGDSNGNYYEPEKTQTALNNQKYISNIYAAGKKDKVIFFDLQLPPSVGGFVIREVGLFDNDNNLLAVAKYPETNKQITDSNSAKTVIIELQIELSDSALNTIIIDNSSTLIDTETLASYINWLDFTETDWQLNNDGLYEIITDKIVDVIGVYRITDNKKELISNIDVQVNDENIKILSLSAFNGSILGTFKTVKGIKIAESTEDEDDNYFTEDELANINITDWDDIDI